MKQQQSNTMKKQHSNNSFPEQAQKTKTQFSLKTPWLNPWTMNTPKTMNTAKQSHNSPNFGSFSKQISAAVKHEFPTPNLRMNIVPMFYENKYEGRSKKLPGLVLWMGKLNCCPKKSNFSIFFLCDFFSSLFNLFLHTTRKEKPSRDLTKITTN